MKLETKSMLSIAAITAAISMIALTGISPANALTFVVTEGTAPDPAQFAPSGGSTLISFDNFAPGTTITPYNFGAGTLTGTNIKIAGDGDDNYLQIGSKGKKTPPPVKPAVTGIATFSFSDSIPYVGLFWNSFLNTDKIEVFLKNGLSEIFTGGQVKAAGVVDGQQFYLNFYESDVAKRITSIAITSTGGYIDNVAYRVPTPALLPGLLGLGVAALRKRKAQATEEASAEV